MSTKTKPSRYKPGDPNWRQRRQEARAAVSIKNPQCKTTGPWQVEVFNQKQDQWNLYSAVRLRPHMKAMDLEEAMEIVTVYNKIPAEFRSVIRIFNTETGDYILAEVLSRG